MDIGLDSVESIRKCTDSQVSKDNNRFIPVINGITLVKACQFQVIANNEMVNVPDIAS